MSGGQWNQETQWKELMNRLDMAQSGKTLDVR